MIKRRKLKKSPKNGVLNARKRVFFADLISSCDEQLTRSDVVTQFVRPSVPFFPFSFLEVSRVFKEASTVSN